MKIRFVIVVLIVFSCLNAYPKNILSRNDYQMSVSVGYGYGHFRNAFGPTPSYRPVVFLLHFAMPVGRAFPFLDNLFSNRWMFYLEPGYSILSNSRSNWEAGLGVGLQYMFNLSRKVKGYFLIGSGFIYITYKSKYQKRGFNFQDNIGSGLLLFISKNKALDIGFRFRHISDADIKKPNDGINDFIGTVGLSFFF